MPRDANDARSGIGIPVRSRGFSQLLDKLRQRRKQAQSDAKPDYAEVEREIARRRRLRWEQAARMRRFRRWISMPQVLVGGKTYRRVLRSVGSYYTMAGAGEHRADSVPGGGKREC